MRKSDKFTESEIEAEKSNANRKVYIGKGGFGTVRFAICLFESVANPGDIVCAKKSKYLRE